MRVVVQRVTSARVTVGDETVGAVGRGLLLLAGIAPGDDERVVARMADKCANLRLFPAAEDGPERSLFEVGGAALVVSQFTLLADVRRGRRPSYVGAAPPELASPLIERFVTALQGLGVEVACGRFGAMMMVESVNDGPMTIVIDSAVFDQPRH